MHRTEADGAAAGGLYTEGDAQLGVPATVVSASAMNSLQEEISKVIEDSGLVLDTKATDTFDQLAEAIRVLIANGGTLAKDVDSLIANNSTDVDVLGAAGEIEFDRTLIISGSFKCDITRNTDTLAEVATGRIFVMFEPKNSVWKITYDSSFDDIGVQFKLLPGSTTDKVKLAYSSDDMSGGTYQSKLILTQYEETKV